jgi:anaerobic carbon-monoxide dehydrogenase iron sulfur subunit
MFKSLHIDPDKCTGCVQCELACSLEHTGEFNPARSRIRVFEFEHGLRSVPYTCTQCDEAWCMTACPVNAIDIDTLSGAKDVSSALCVGCKACVTACPFGTIMFNPDSGKVDKCDLCGGDPKCAEACPTGAIVYGDADWSGLDKMRQSALTALMGR